MKCKSYIVLFTGSLCLYYLWICTLKLHQLSVGGAMLRTGVHTFLSGGSRGLQLFARSWWSSSNLRLMFSMESWSMSQKPARSEATGRGWALGFCRVETRWTLRWSAVWKIMDKQHDTPKKWQDNTSTNDHLLKILSPTTLWRAKLLFSLS